MEVLLALGAHASSLCRVVRNMRGVGHYTRGWRTGDALAWGKFIGLRSDPHAQYEVRVMSDAARTLLEAQLPNTVGAMRDYWWNAVRLSAEEQHLSADYIPSINAELVQSIHNSLFAEAERTEWIDNKDHTKGRRLKREWQQFLDTLAKITAARTSE